MKRRRFLHLWVEDVGDYAPELLKQGLSSLYCTIPWATDPNMGLSKRPRDMFCLLGN